MSQPHKEKNSKVGGVKKDCEVNNAARTILFIYVFLISIYA